MSLSKGKNWEGLGGPVHYDSSETAGRKNKDASDDPTLDSCCQKDMEEQRVGAALRTTLRKYDIVAERERRRRHTVSFNHSSSTLYMGGFHGTTNIGSDTKNDSGCRCSYDPNGDGGEYRALTELRMERSRNNDENEDEDEYTNSKKYRSDDDDDDINQTRGMESQYGKGVNVTPLETKKASGNTENETDDDDEYDYLLDEDDLPSGSGDNTSYVNNTLKTFEEQRRMELEWEIFQNEIAMLHGYGIHRQIHPQRILSIAGLRHSSQSLVEPPPFVVMHLVDADSIGSASLDLYLEVLATKFRGTMFVRSSGRATLLLNDVPTIDTVLPMFRSYTSAQNVDAALPALVAIRHGTAVNACLQLQGLLSLSTKSSSSSSYSRDSEKSSSDIEPSAVRDWLDRCGVLHERPPNIDTMCRIRPEEEALLDSCTRRQPEAIEDEQRYDCGKNGCSKSFPHEHIGERNEQQDGLLISEAAILS